MSGRVDVEKRMREMGVRPKRSLGQNFLVAEHVAEKIVGEALRVKPEKIIEVGPGLGALTEAILKSGVPLQLIELDSEFAAYWRRRGCDVIEDDALRVNWEQLSYAPATTLLSNLPYQIASRLIIDRSVGPTAINRMVLMMQKEVAQRVTAAPRTKDYGFLTVVAQTYWRARVVCDAGPGDFHPAPKVASRVLVFERLNQHRPEKFVQFVKTAFTNRRKYMMKNFADWPELGGLLRARGYFEKVRAEEITPEDFLAIYDERSR